MGAPRFGIGQSVKRVEDVRFVTGAGRYTGDISLQGMAQAVVVRSPHAHARFSIGDLADLKRMPGVLAVFTHDDVAHLGDLPCQGTVKNADGSRMRVPGYPVLPKDEVRHIGEAVAFIVSGSEMAARDAADAFPVSYEPLPAAIGIEHAGAPDAPLVWPDLGTNLAFDARVGDRDRTEAAFTRAARIVSMPLVNNRLVANYLETRACIAEFDASRGRYTLTLGSQGPHDIRDTLCEIMGIAPEQMRVVTPDVGGGFGTKIFMYREYPLCALAAERLRRPVRWVSERSEHYVADTHGRDNLAFAEMALDEQGRFLAMRVDLRADMGAYLSQFAPFIPWLGAGMTPGCYDIPVVDVRVRGYFTHTVPVDAYRGAGRPEAAYVIERFVDHIAREIGADPAALRTLNFVKPEQMPYRTATGRVYDSGDFEGTMRRAMELADWPGFPERVRTASAVGRLRGIGLATYVEACAGGSPEEAKISVDPTGRVTVLIGTQSTGQGHLTAYTQLVAEQLDVPLETIEVIQGDTDRIRTGGGTGGSRSIPVGGAAVAAATATLVKKIKDLAADALEASSGDLEIVEGQVRIVGTDRRVSLANLAERHAQDPSALTAVESWKPPEATYPNGTHVCEIEIDPDTGTVSVERYTIVDDFGVTLNPLLLAGQVHGGAAQGIGQALHEWTVFDEAGQLLTASIMDYRLPRADDIPHFIFETRNVPCATNALGMKGAGEAGAIGACPAVMNAVADALYRATGSAQIDMPATPGRVFSAILASTSRASKLI